MTLNDHEGQYRNLLNSISLKHSFY